MIKQVDYSFEDMVAQVPPEISARVDLEFAIGDRIYELMQQRGLTNKTLAEALGTRPGVVAQWISGQYNFSTRTLARLTAYFGEPIVSVAPCG